MFSVVHLSIVTSSTVQFLKSFKISRIWTWVKHVWNPRPCRHKRHWQFKHENNISVNIYRYEDKKIFPLRMTTVTIARDQVNLLYITAGETSYYVLVKDLKRLVLRQYNNHNNKKYFCQNCLYASEEVLQYHLVRCKSHEVQRIKLPGKATGMGVTKSNL